MILLLLALGCPAFTLSGAATVIDACAADPEWCITCDDAADCAFTGNPCTETVYCAHADAQIPVIQIGCDPAVEYTWPDPESCACVAGACAATP